MHCETVGTVVFLLFLHDYVDIYLFNLGGTVGGGRDTRHGTAMHLSGFDGGHAGDACVAPTFAIWDTGWHPQKTAFSGLSIVLTASQYFGGWDTGFI